MKIVEDRFYVYSDTWVVYVSGINNSDGKIQSTVIDGTTKECSCFSNDFNPDYSYSFELLNNDKLLRKFQWHIDQLIDYNKR